MTDRLVSYSLAVRGPEVSDQLLRQLEISWSSLRHFNRTQPVVLFMHGPLPPSVARLSRAFDVMVDVGPNYEQRLAEHSPSGASALAAYPTLHKFLNHTRLATSGARHVLCCDCDTVFAGDVEHLFARYGHVANVVGREEMSCRRSPHGYDPAFIDEDAIAELARFTTGRSLPPFNLGAVMLSDVDWTRLASIEPRFVELAWRFATWMTLHPGGPGARFADFIGADAATRDMTDEDVERALPYPSDNPWILDEVCLWLAYGELAELTFADFADTDVAQNGEFARSNPAAPGWTMCHYFSSSLAEVERWLRAAA